MKDKKGENESVVKQKKSPQESKEVPQVIMCKLPLENLKAVCDWLNGDDMPLPQNQIRRALALLFVAEVTEE